MEFKTPADVLFHEIRDLHSAETQLVEALPKIAAGVSSPALRAALEQHLEETHAQLEQVTALLEHLEAKPSKSKCVGMAGILKEGSDLLTAKGDDVLTDLALIGACQRVEHYEMAGYDTARRLAEALEIPHAVQVLEAILDQESNASDKLVSIAESLSRKLAGAAVGTKRNGRTR